MLCCQQWQVAVAVAVQRAVAGGRLAGGGGGNKPMRGTTVAPPGWLISG